MEVLTLILAIILYLTSPGEYDFTLCALVFLIYVFIAYRAVKQSSQDKNYVNFTLFFSISYLFVNFFYPLFIYPVAKDYFLVFGRFHFDEDVITKSTCLALVGYCSFVVGKKKYKKVDREFLRHERKNIRVLNNVYKVITFFTWVTVGCVFILGLKGIVERRFDTFFKVPPSLLVLTQCLVNLSIILVFYLNKGLKKLFVQTLFLLMFVYVGDRGPAIQTAMAMLISYSLFYRKIKKYQILTVFILGFVSLTIVSSIRSRSGAASIKGVEYSNYYDFAMDLIINNRNLYAGYEYAEKNGLNYGTGSIHYIFAPIPLLPSFTTKTLFNKTPAELSSAAILTDEADATWGLGTNLIADIYMQFGFVGVLILMYMLGHVIKHLELNLYSGFFYLISYIFIFSFSIYMPRSSMFDVVRYIAWASVIFFFFSSFFKSLLKKYAQ